VLQMHSLCTHLPFWSEISPVSSPQSLEFSIMRIHLVARVRKCTHVSSARPQPISINLTFTENAANLRQLHGSFGPPPAQ
jgi:hypothetical protein